jgi:ssDNA-binding Zn-finger/Zn-ribbon topoisomerase 1
MSRAPFLSSLARFFRSFFAGRRKSDAVFARVLRSDSDTPTAWKELNPSPDAKPPLCPRCGAVMIHAKGERTTRPEFWACSRLQCDGVRDVQG